MALGNRGHGSSSLMLADSRLSQNGSSLVLMSALSLLPLVSGPAAHGVLDRSGRVPCSACYEKLLTCYEKRLPC